MKTSHIIGIVAIAIAIVVIISTAGDASSYVSFATAQEMATSGESKSIHVVGKLTKDQEGNVVGLEESADKLSFTFNLIDNEGTRQEVFYNEPMPADFLRSEQVVVIGAYKSNHFVADQILMKCPSKYQETEI